MRREIFEKIKIPEGVEVKIIDGEIILKHGNHEVSRKYEGFEAKIENGELVLGEKKATKNEKKLIKTIAAHIRNSLRGFENKYVYKLQVCAVHFPMTITLDKAKHELTVKNFLGEVRPRIAKVLKDVEVKVDKEIITVEGHDREHTGQTAANIERVTRITNRDRRTFQDGIFLIEKP